MPCLILCEVSQWFCSGMSLSLFGLPNCFFLVITPYLLPVPRCLVGLSSTCKFCRDYWRPRILNLISRRIFLNHLHIQTRIGCIRALSRFACCYEFYSVRTIKMVFRTAFNSDDAAFREAAISFLFKLSDKFSYCVILSEFRKCNDKDEFARLCRGKTIECLGHRDPVSCPKIHICLFSHNNSFKIVALNILRFWAEKWTENILDIVRTLSWSENRAVRVEAGLSLDAHRRSKKWFAVPGIFYFSWNSELIFSFWVTAGYRKKYNM